MPQWVHDRARHLRDKNPDMPESMSWALATQQAYAANKAPKSYGTSEGRAEAHRKYDEPTAQYRKTADPPSKTKSSGLSLDMLGGFVDEFTKIAAFGVADVTKSVKNTSLSIKPPKLVSKLPKTELQTPGQTLDTLAGARNTSPPPVTATSPVAVGSF